MIELVFVCCCAFVAYWTITAVFKTLRLGIDLCVQLYRSMHQRVPGKGLVPTGVSPGFLWDDARTRLRRRSRWVRGLQALLGGEVGVVANLVRRRWTPDLPAPGKSPLVNFMAALSEDGVQILGGGSVPAWSDDGVITREAYLTVRLIDGHVATVYPSLLAKLVTLAAFRKRDQSTAALLRMRALEWARATGLSWADFAAGMVDTVCLGLKVPANEQSSVDWMTKQGLASSVVA